MQPSEWLKNSLSAAFLGLAGAYYWTEEYQELQRIKLQSLNTLNWVIVQLRHIWPVETRTPEQNTQIAQACYECSMVSECLWLSRAF